MMLSWSIRVRAAVAAVPFVGRFGWVGGPLVQRRGAIKTGAPCTAVLRAAALLTAACTSRALAPVWLRFL